MAEPGSLPPYAADTSAKGWRFELAMEKVRQSDTWSLTMLRGYEPKTLLVWMWSVAWEQTPCGSFPNDEALIAGRLELPQKVWQKNRDILMRNWWLASDGRLYHDTIVERVLAMLEKRANDAKRAADRRARKADALLNHAIVTCDAPVIHSEVGCEFDTKHQAPSTKEEKSVRKRSPSFDAEGIELPPWLDREVWQGWCKERRSRGKPITERSAKEQLKSLDEYRRNGHTPERVISHAIASGNQGLFPPPVIRSPQGVGAASEPVKVWKAPPPLTQEEREASHRAKEIAMSAIKIVRTAA